MKFIKSMYNAYVNDCSVGMYRDGTSIVLKVERREHADPKNAETRFDTEDQAQAWYDNFPGSGLGKMDNVIECLCADPFDFD